MDSVNSGTKPFPMKRTSMDVYGARERGVFNPGARANISKVR